MRRLFMFVFEMKFKLTKSSYVIFVNNYICYHLDTHNKLGLVLICKMYATWWCIFITSWFNWNIFCCLTLWSSQTRGHSVQFLLNNLGGLLWDGHRYNKNNYASYRHNKNRHNKYNLDTKKTAIYYTLRDVWKCDL